jgi:hypothetical protein
MSDPNAKRTVRRIDTDVGTTFRRAERIPLDDVVHFDRW